MNAVEIEAALSDLALEPFDADEFPYQFLAAFGNKDVTLKRLRTYVCQDACVELALFVASCKSHGVNSCNRCIASFDVVRACA